MEWHRSHPPVRLFPFVLGDREGRSGISIDSHQAFGRPIVARQGMSMAGIADRIDAGEPAASLPALYLATRAKSSGASSRM